MTNYDIVMGYLFNGGIVLVSLWSGYWVTKLLIEEYLRYKQGPRPKDTTIRTSSGKVRHRKN